MGWDVSCVRKLVVPIWRCTSCAPCSLGLLGSLWSEKGRATAQVTSCLWCVLSLLQVRCWADVGQEKDGAVVAAAIEIQVEV